MRKWTAAIVAALFALQVGGAPATAATALVCLDPGHGGTDPGAVRGDLQEKTLNLEIANKVRALLETDGVLVKLTREDDATSLGNSARAEICNAAGATVVLSIHLNASTNASVDYFQVFYGKRTKDLAFTKTIFDNYALQNASYTGALQKNAITNFANGTLLKSKAPAALAEAVFLSNTNEQALFRDPASTRKDEIARELHKGLAAWLARP